MTHIDYSDDDRHEDPPVRVSDAVKIELAIDEIMRRAEIKGSDDRRAIVEETDPKDLGLIFLAILDAKGDQQRSEVQDAAKCLAEQAARRIAKLRAEH